MRKLLLCMALVALAPIGVAADWPTFHGDNTRQGNDTTSPGLSAPLTGWTSPLLDGNVYGSPLIVAGRVIVATENNSVYSLDPSTGAVQWSSQVGAPRFSNFPCGNINPLGITGTPAVDGTNVYAVAEIQDTPTSFHFDLDTLDLNTGSVTRRVNITPAGMNVNNQQQRGALLVNNGRVFVPIGGLNGDCGLYHGYVLSYPETGVGTLQSFTVAAGNNRGGIWATGGTSAADAGSVYVSTGNSALTSGNPAYDYSDGVVKLSSSTTQPTDYFAPSNWVADNAGDVDLGSTAPLQLPNSQIFIVGKSGVGYLLNAANLGHIGVQLPTHRVCHASNGAAFGSLAYANGAVYVGCSDGMARVTISGNDFSSGWYNTTNVADHPPTIAGGKVWAVDRSGANLLAFDPANGSQANSFPIGNSTHFTTPSASNNQLYVASLRAVHAYTAVAQPPVNGATLDGFGSPHHFGSVASNLGNAPYWGPSFDIARALALRSDHTGGYVLDGYGGLHAIGTAPAMATFAYWPNWDIARSVVLGSDALGGYVLDGFGGIHPFGNAPSVVGTAYWPGWAIATSIVLRSDNRSGWVMDGVGGLHPFAAAGTVMPPSLSGPYWPGWAIARGVSIVSDTGGYLLDGLGGVHAVGSAAPVGVSAYWPNWDIARGITVYRSSPVSGYVLDGWGGVHEFGAAQPATPSSYLPGHDVFHAVAATP